MKNPLLVPEFREMIAENNLEEIKEFCNTTPPSVVADFLGALTPEENREILMHLSSETRSKIFSYFDNDVKLSLIDMFDNDQMVDLIAGMHDDKQLDFLTLLPVDKQKGILDLSRRSLEKEDIELTEVLDKLVKSETPIEEEMTSDELAGEIRPLVKVYKLADGAIKPVDRIEKNTWVNIVNPPRDDPDLMYITLPIGIILVNGLLLTVCPKEEIVLHDFIVGKVKNITTISGHKFILQIIYRSLVLYLQYLKQINNAANMIQKKLEQESKNKQLIKLMNLEKCLVYFTTSLKTNELMLERIQKHGIVQKSDELEDLFEDIVIETRQALEMANVYSDILSGMMDAFASVISNNLNITIKFLTSVTIIITIPATIAAFFGMNVRIPFQEHPDGFIFVIIASLILSIAAVLFFIKKRWL
jgi:magnesium transporter